MLLRFALLAVFLCGGLQPAHAQDQGAVAFADGGGALFKPDVSGTRLQPEYDPKGIVVHSFRVFPSVTTAAGFDSNVFNVDSTKSADAYFAVESKIMANSDWGRHQLDVGASARITRYASKARENNEEFGFSISGRLDVANKDAIFGRIDFRQQTESRGSGGQRLVGAEPSAFGELNAGLATRQTFGPVRLEVSASLERRVFDPVRLISGGQFDQSFRDSETIQIAPRLQFAVTPHAGIFLAATASRTKTLNPTSLSDRSATGRRLLVGARGEIGSLMIAEVGVGWQSRDYKSSTFLDYAGFSYLANIDWYPTPLLSFRLTANQEFQNSGIVTVAAIRNSSLQLASYYELFRNVKVTFKLRNDRGDYRELAVVTKTSSATATVVIDASPRLSAGAMIGLRRRASSDPSLVGKYGGATITLSLTGRM